MQNYTQTLPGKPTSLWLGTTPETSFPSLTSGLTVDVAIIGGGIAGLTAATLLKASGKTVAVLDGQRIVQRVTGHTSAKITSLHELIYDRLIRQFGAEKARAYADANQSAIEQIATLVQEKRVDCDFHRSEAYTYTENEGEMDKIQAEFDAAIQLKLPVTLLQETPLPFPIKAAVRFDNQAQFHPRKYLLALAHDIPGDGSYIFENSKVTEFDEGEPCTLTTERGTITARDIIVASHFPFNDKTLYAFRLHSHRSYVLAVRLEVASPRGMFISTGSTHSMRAYPAPGDDLWMVGGEGHKTGEGGDTIARYQRLEEWARAHFAVKEVEYRWSTQDNKTLDGVPYIGRYAPNSEHVYVATGFGGWGMTGGTVAGMILRDAILGRDNPWAEVYDPNRVNLEGVPEALKQVGGIAKHFVGDRLTNDKPEELAPGEGRIVEANGGHIAMYKAEDGTMSTLSPACTHMGCLVQWNPAEKSWDCPCHGSRFAADGKVIQGPAIYDLKKVENSS